MPMAKKAIEDFYARNEIASLFRHVKNDIRKSHLLPSGMAQDVVKRLDGLLVQPNIAGALQKWLDTGDSSIRQPLQASFEQLLNFDGVGSDVLAKLVVDAIDANLFRAKRTDREAAHHDNQMLRGVLDELKADMARDFQSDAATVTARALRIARDVMGLGASTAAIVAKLIADDPDGAIPMQEALSAGGSAHVADAIRDDAPWLAQGSAPMWEAAGRLAQATGQLAEAQRAYEHAAAHAGVKDRARQLVRASYVAAERNEADASAKLLEAAREHDPQNPAVLLRDARDADDPSVTLAQLEAVEPVDDDQAVLAECIRAEALITVGNFDLAREAIDRARATGSDSPADELDAIATLTEAHDGISASREPNTEKLSLAAETFLRLYHESSENGRWDVAGVYLGRAAVCLALAGNTPESRRRLDEAMGDGRLHTGSEARRVLVSAALLVRRFDVVLRLVPENDDETDRLERAAAQVLGGDPDMITAAATELRDLMGSAGPGADRAAYLLLCAATNNIEIPWDTDAEQMVAEREPLAAAMLHAFRLDAENDLEGAEAVVLPHSDQPDALRQLIHLALRRDAYMKAVRLSETLVQRTGAPTDRLLLASALDRSGQRSTAIDKLLALGRDEHASFDDRRIAWRRACLLQQEGEDFVELEATAREWAGKDPDPEPRWTVLLAIAMQMRHADALSEWRKFGEPAADALGRAQLLAEIFALAGEPPETLAMLASLSDQYDRPEDLEISLMLTTIRCGDIELEEDLEARIRESFKTFPERFPESRAMRAISLDLDDPVKSLIDALGEQLEHRSERTQALLAEIRVGRSPAAMLAAAAGRSTGETLFLLEGLPVTYPNDQFERLDKADAAAALATGAIWDGSSIFVVAALRNDLEKPIRAALPASAVARATQQETAQDLAMANSEQRGEIAFTGSTLQLSEWSEFAQASNRHRIVEMHRLATNLPARPIPSDGEPDELITIAASEAPAPIRSWAATFAVARASGLPVYSDDRAVRRGAREIGLRAFGTMALVDVLQDKGMVSSEIRDRVRRRLLSHGALGARYTVEELVQLARQSNWQPNSALRAVLGDASVWFALASSWLDRVLGFLEAVFREAPSQMDSWVHRMIDVMTYDVGGDYESHARLLILAALNPFSEPIRMSDGGLQALIASVRRMRYFEIYCPQPDLLVQAMTVLLEAGEDSPTRAGLFAKVCARLSEQDQAQLRDRFVR
jgi:tetratricopeptide (TPR) repeat protein